MTKWEYAQLHEVSGSFGFVKHTKKEGSAGTSETWSFQSEKYDLDGSPLFSLNQIGAEGWELVTVDSGYYIFKRPISN